MLELFGGQEVATRRERVVVERWLSELAPPGHNAWFLQGYQDLRAAGWAWKEAMCIAWLSLGRDDRGELETVADLCDYLGVSRMWYYERKARYNNDPAQGMNAWDWWAERLQLQRLRGQRLAEVDEAVYRRAVSLDGKAADRELYYKRARVLTGDTNVAVTVGQAVDVTALGDDALDALLARGGGAGPGEEIADGPEEIEEGTA